MKHWKLKVCKALIHKHFCKIGNYHNCKTKYLFVRIMQKYFQSLVELQPNFLQIAIFEAECTFIT